MNGRQDNNIFRASTLFIVCIYFLLGNFMLGSGWSPSISFNAFAKHQTEQTRYELKFTEIHGEQLDEPVYFADMNGMLGDDDIYEGKRLVNRLGHAVYSEDIVATRELNAELERTYLWTLEPAEYQVVFIDTDPIEKYNTNEYISEWVLSSYSIPIGEPIAAEIFE